MARPKCVKMKLPRKPHNAKQGPSGVPGGLPDATYISETKEYVDDAIVKKVFLNCWKKLELGFVNVDHLLNQIHMLYDKENGTSIIGLVLKRMGNILKPCLLKIS